MIFAGDEVGELIAVDGVEEGGDNDVHAWFDEVVVVDDVCRARHVPALSTLHKKM